VQTLQVKHLKHWGVVSLLKADFCYRALPWTELILRDRRFINDLNLQLSSRVSVILTYGLVSSLVGAWWLPGSLAIAGVMIVLLLVQCTPVQLLSAQAVYGLPSGDSVALALLLLQWLSIRHRHGPPRPQAQRFQTIPATLEAV